MFPVKHTVIDTFFGYNVSPKHLFLQCFQCSGIQKPCKILLCTMFFSFLAVFPLPESYQTDPKFRFNTLLGSDAQKSSKNVENTTECRSRCETVLGSGLGAKPFLGNKRAVFYAFVARKPVQNIMFDNASNSLISPTVENTAIYSVFFNFSMFQCR